MAKPRHCIVCGRTNPDSAHIKSRGSGGPDADWNLIDLCRLHHIEQHTIGWVSFFNKHSAVRRVLISKGWEILGLKLWNDLLVRNGSSGPTGCFTWGMLNTHAEELVSIYRGCKNEKIHSAILQSASGK